MLTNFSCFCWRLLTLFQNYLYQIILSETLTECQSVSIQIRTDVRSVLIWVQTVCKRYPQTTKVVDSTDNENIKHLTCKINNHFMPYLIIYPDEQNALGVKLRIFPYLSILIFGLDAQKNRPIETVLLSTHNICFG